MSSRRSPAVRYRPEVRLQNSLTELFTLLRFILPSLFDTRAEEVFQQNMERSGEGKTSTACRKSEQDARPKFRYDAGLLGALRTIIEPFMLRRSKAEGG